jgi:hypothetical protein
MGSVGLPYARPGTTVRSGDGARGVISCPECWHRATQTGRQMQRGNARAEIDATIGLAQYRGQFT